MKNKTMPKKMPMKVMPGGNKTMMNKEMQNMMDEIMKNQKMMNGGGKKSKKVKK